MIREFNQDLTEERSAYSTCHGPVYVPRKCGAYLRIVQRPVSGAERECVSGLTDRELRDALAAVPYLPVYTPLEKLAEVARVRGLLKAEQRKRSEAGARAVAHLRKIVRAAS